MRLKFVMAQHWASSQPIRLLVTNAITDNTETYSSVLELLFAPGEGSSTVAVKRCI
jgi:hypothetical protein